MITHLPRHLITPYYFDTTFMWCDIAMPSFVTAPAMANVRLQQLLPDIQSSKRPGADRLIELYQEDEEYKDGIFSAHGCRVTITGHPTTPHPPHMDSSFRFLEPNDDVHRRPLIFLAALKCDKPLLLEMLRWGASLEVRDAYGYTPLLACLLFARVYTTAIRDELMGHPPCAAGDDRAAPQMRAFQSALAGIAMVFIQYHANVNVSADGVFPLSLACNLQQWELIDLLVAHGADPSTATTDGSVPFGTDAASAQRFRELVDKYTAADGSRLPRPARPCPCASEHPLDACHASGEEHPYPPSFFCPCRSGRSYARCCKAGGQIMWTESWNHATQVIVPHADLSRPLLNREAAAGIAYRVQLPPAEVLQWLFSKFAATFTRNPSLLYMREDELARFLVPLLAAKNLGVDKAFLHLYNEADSLPSLPSAANRPEDFINPFPDVEAEVWNKALDRYIRSGRDDRPASELEPLLKVDPDGRPLWKCCEACSRIENVPGGHRRCSRCKQAFYCSTACQKDDWKKHKRLCGPDFPQQLIPSHEMVFAVMTALLDLGLRKFWVLDAWSSSQIS